MNSILVRYFIDTASINIEEISNKTYRRYEGGSFQDNFFG